MPNPDQLDVTWDAVPGNTNSQLAESSVRFGAGTTWVVVAVNAFADGYTAGTDDEDPDLEYRFDFQSDHLATGLAVVKLNGTPVA